MLNSYLTLECENIQNKAQINTTKPGDDKK